MFDFLSYINLFHHTYCMQGHTVEPLSKDTPDLSTIAVLASCVFFVLHINQTVIAVTMGN